MTTKIPLNQRSFAAGEVSQDLWGRTDLIKYQTGLAVGRNSFVRFQGGVSSRQGTQYVGVNPDLDDGLSPRVVPFIFNNEQAYVLEFDSRGIRIIQDGSYITTTAKAITGSFTADDKVDEKFTLFGRVDNLFDKRYENPVGFLVPGLSAFGGIRVSL